MTHRYPIRINWTGNSGQGTASYTSYERSYEIEVDGKPLLQGSADPQFRGEADKYNPEELLVAAISSCHMLWYLHLCSSEKIIVTNYQDHAEGLLSVVENGSGQFTKVDLYPVVEVSDPAMAEQASALHKKVAEFCFISRSVNFPVHHHPRVKCKTTT